MTTEKIRITDFDQGIRKLVRRLNGVGYECLDAGDGESRHFMCDRRMGYVVLAVRPDALAAEANAVVTFLEEWGLKVVPIRRETPPEGHCWVQANYVPADGYALIDISYVHDRMLRKGTDA